MILFKNIFILELIKSLIFVKYKNIKKLMLKYQFIFIIVFISTGLTYSQTNISSYIFINAGVSIPAIEQDYSKTYTLGPSLTGGLGFKLNDKLIAKIGVGYNHFYLKENVYVSGLSIISYDLSLNFGNYKDDNLTPYVIAGLSAYTLSDFGSNQTNLGINFGFGISGAYNKNIIPFGEIQLNYNFNSGIAKGYFPIRAGAIFKL